MRVRLLPPPGKLPVSDLTGRDFGGAPTRGRRADGQLQIGTGSPSVSTEVAEIQKLVRSSGLNYTLHSAGTTIGESTDVPRDALCGFADSSAEGPWNEVMSLVGKAHTLVHQTGCARIQTDIRVGTR